ncbi:MAG: hypothetical protein EX285_05015 [Thaumarchaeota archaeon]|nr:hypothetical protein [Nitrososphaerota archaeon]
MKSKKISNETFDLGTRKVTPMNFSMVCTLPKIFTDKYLPGDKKRSINNYVRWQVDSRTCHRYGEEEIKISKGIEHDMASLEYEQLPYIKYGDYKSSDRLHPDTLNITIVDKETFETTYSINARIKLGDKDIYLPIKNKNSNNSILLELWKKEVVNNPAIKIGSKLRLYT